jgi:hypothetical protein
MNWEPLLLRLESRSDQSVEPLQGAWPQRPTQQGGSQDFLTSIRKLFPN